MSLCFQRVVVYQPAHAKPDKSVELWTNTGLLDVRSPFEETVDKRSLEAAIRDLKSWGLMHRHADMALLKHVGNTFEFVSPETPKIKSEIRGRKAPNAQNDQETDFSAHVFLHLAEEFDRESRDLNQQLKMVGSQYQALQRSFQQDQEEDPGTGVHKQPASMTGTDPGNLMIDKRMTAWNHLFQKDSAGSNLLFTDSDPAFTYLLEGLEEKIELLNVEVRHGGAGTDGATKSHVPWSDHLLDIFYRILTTPWTSVIQESVVQAVHEISSEMDAWKESTSESSTISYSFRWYAVPGMAGQSLLNQRLGQETEMNGNTGVNNTVVGLVQEMK
ncbi:MAG: hypothetical protein JRI47_04575, partial [Deltaproteobacteria bacterium]|nr:hypothetical protein [Deltaproteobacteria bacterium]